MQQSHGLFVTAKLLVHLTQYTVISETINCAETDSQTKF